MNRSAIGQLPMASSTGWFIMLIASKCAEIRCARIAASQTPNGRGRRSVMREIEYYRNEPKRDRQEPIATAAPPSAADDKCSPCQIQQEEPGDDRKDTGKPDERLSCNRNDPMLLRHRPTGRSRNHINDCTDYVQGKQGEAYSSRQKELDRKFFLFRHDAPGFSIAFCGRAPCRAPS